jgi:hypothetical protein
MLPEIAGIYGRSFAKRGKVMLCRESRVSDVIGATRQRRPAGDPLFYWKLQL